MFTVAFISSESVAPSSSQHSVYKTVGHRLAITRLQYQSLILLVRRRSLNHPLQVVQSSHTTVVEKDLMVQPVQSQ